MPLDFEPAAAVGSQLGTRSVQTFDDTTCVVGAVLRWTEFYQHESCGKCTPCREGMLRLVRIWTGWNTARAPRAKKAGKLLDICDNITGRAFCAPGERDSPDHLRPPLLQDESSQHHKEGVLPLRSGGVDGLERAMTVETTQEMVTVTIDGFEIVVPKGTWIIRAAETPGIAILRFW